jgi:hypothetical protein
VTGSDAGDPGTGTDAPERGPDAPPAAAPRTERLEWLIASLAARADVALRLESPGLERLLRSIVEATVELFDAEAASIALVEPDGRLRFRVAAGAQGPSVVGLTVAAGEGIAGFVLATAQPLAIANVSADSRFDAEAAARTGYVPRSVLAVPLEANDRVIGVLEVLDRRDGGAFGLRDVALAGVFARQAATAIDVSRVDRDLVRLVAAGIAASAGGAGPGGESGDAGSHGAWESMAADAVAATAGETSPAFWRLVDRLAQLRAADPGRIELVTDVLDAALRHLAPASGGLDHGPARRSWRERAGRDAGP